MDQNIFSALYQRLKDGKSSVLIRIIHREGSAPRGVGSSCLVDAEGELTGTIGGGLLEYRAIEKAKLLLEKRLTSFSTIEMNSKEIEEEGMICGGKVELFFEPILAEDKAALELFSKIAKMVKEGGRGVLATQLCDGVDALAFDTRMLVTSEGNRYGTIPGVSTLNQVSRAELLHAAEDDPALFLEPVRQQPELILFGGGHISTFVASLAKMVGFLVRVVDDRSEFANRDRFANVDDIYAMSYTEAFREIGITEESYLVIVTRGHGMDKEVLELALNLGFFPAYIGMIGSLRKRDTIYKAIIDGGTDKELLGRVYSPIGLDIGAQTPEEIAVSIIAEIIEVRAGGKVATNGSCGSDRIITLGSMK